MASSGDLSRSIPRSPAHDALRGHLLRAYAGIVGARASAENYLATYLRRHKEVRGSARGFLGAAAFTLLRYRTRTLCIAVRARGGDPKSLKTDDLHTLLPANEESAFAVLRWLVEELGAAQEEALAVLADAAGERFPIPEPEQLRAFLNALAHPPAEPTLSEEFSLAPDLAERWAVRFSPKELRELAQAMLLPAPLDLRVNSRRKTRTELLALLHQAGTGAKPCRFAPEGIRLTRKVNLSTIAELRPGDYEIQDEGSQLVAEALGAGEGRVLDACAGAGGKSLQLATHGWTVQAHDSDAARLEKLPARAEAAGVRVRSLDPGTAADHAPFDAVLIDAPCLGLGRLRREPALAWMTDRLSAMAAAQRECLESYAPLVRPGGVVVYATCSFEPEETDQQIDRFLTAHPDFTADPLPEIFQGAEMGNTRSPDGSRVFLLPSMHGTDGFFIARLRRRA